MQFFKFTLLILLLLNFEYGNSQQKETDTVPGKSNIFNYAMKFIKKKNVYDTLNQQSLLIAKSENAFKQYEGKIIRHIIFNKYKFEKTLSDTSGSINYFGTRLLNALHNNTKEWAIRQDLFIRENTPVYANLFADNERYLRSLPYIQDARIIIQPKTGSPDSVDVYVITKDLFSINFVLNQATTGKFKAKVEDVNLFGAAQSLQATVLVQKDRVPVSGVDFKYTKFNVAHSFINASIGYSNISPDLSDDITNEHAFTISLQRNLVSQYTHFAGGLMLGNLETFNNYKKPDSIFYKYHSHLFDTWVGYNLGIKKYLTDKTRLNRKFVSIRYLNEHFTEIPAQVNNNLFFRFNDKHAILGQLTYFRQEFYKTNYLFGFGNTEDVPQGYNIAATAGWYKQAYLSRMYAGIDANRYLFNNKGDIIQYFLRAGSFFNHGELQDAGILLGTAGFSRLFQLGNFKMRQYFRFSFTKLYNRIGLDPLNINNTFGLRYFKTDSVRGEQRVSLHAETIGFIKYKVFGFKFSPFVFADIAGLKLDEGLQGIPNWYYGIGAGLRTRNENLVFKTTEVRFAYFPHTAFGVSQFTARLVANIEFRYNTNYVRMPDIIQYNSDYENNIF